MPWLRSSCSLTASIATGAWKLGQPLPDSYLASESKSAAPHATQRYSPASLWFQYLPVKGGSVAEQRQTAYCSSVSSSRHSASVRSCAGCVIVFAMAPMMHDMGSDCRFTMDTACWRPLLDRPEIPECAQPFDCCHCPCALPFR